ncbi:MAG: DNA repair protein RecO [Gammaproteobacteria bacterium]|nr:DNA repair protein RecO [Gammaproteobacteria bacterium]MCP5197624.1 DNA repair protein RecO [Gammaproteobacteria bacterium]
MRVLLQSAFILHRRPYRDTSLLLEAFSPEYGRLALVARGAASSRSRLKGLLQPFIPLLLSWTGDSDLVTLISGEEDRTPIPLLQDRALAGLYANELLVRLLPRGEAQPELFNAYAVLLEELATATDEEPPLRRFEKRLLEELGYGLSLSYEAASGAPIIAEAHYHYVLDQGPLAIDRTQSGIPISGQGLLALRDGMLNDPAILREVKQLTRAALALQLQGRVLKTRALYRIKREA